MAFKIPKPPVRGQAFSYFTKHKYEEMSDKSIVSELEGVPIAERTLMIGEMWKHLTENEKKQFEEMAASDHLRRMRIWDSQRGERDAEKRKHCRKLGIDQSSSWEQIKRAYENPSSITQSRTTSGNSASNMKRDSAVSDNRQTPSSPRNQSEGKRRRVSGDNMEDPQWSTAWEPVLRKKAILRGLDEVFRMAQDSSNFDVFGNDVIQCFYDVGLVSGSPVRERCLKYVSQLAHRYKHSVMTVGWKLGDEPRPDEVIQAAIGMYCMERVGVSHDLKSEVTNFLLNSDTSFTPNDYFGWNPLEGPPPLTGHSDENGPISVYRAMSNSLIHSFYADRAGLKLAGCSYKDVFQYVHMFRPWSGPETMTKADYVDQCYLVTHVVFTLNNWGELMLDKDIAPHEYCFARNHLALQIAERDVHLVGELIEVLRCFGCTDEDPLLRAGMAFLLANQSEDGLWDADKDPYTVYHATMVGIQALLAHNYRGYGPGITSVEPLMLKWSQADASNDGAVIGEYCKLKQNGGDGDDASSGAMKDEDENDAASNKMEGGDKEGIPKEDKTDGRLLSLRTAAEHVLSGKYKGPRVTEAASSTTAVAAGPSAAAVTNSNDPHAQAIYLSKELDSVVDSSELLKLLNQASKLVVSIEMLRESGIGKAVKKVGKRSEDDQCKQLADTIVADWKAQLN